MADIVELVDLADRDQRIFDLRVQGKSVRTIARQFRIAMKEVDAIVESYCTPIDMTAKARAFELEMHRIDALQDAAYGQAIGGNISAIMACAKLMERRAACTATRPRSDMILFRYWPRPPRPRPLRRIQKVLDDLAQRQLEKPSEPDIEQE